jgi:hypothetical protein
VKGGPAAPQSALYAMTEGLLASLTGTFLGHHYHSSALSAIHRLPDQIRHIRYHQNHKERTGHTWSHLVISGHTWSYLVIPGQSRSRALLSMHVMRVRGTCVGYALWHDMHDMAMLKHHITITHPCQVHAQTPHHHHPHMHMHA